MMEEERIGIFPNLQKEQVREVMPKLAVFCQKEGISIAYPKEIAGAFGVPAYDQELPDSMRHLTLALTLGGDGTILRAARYVTPVGLPLIGINMGKVGFLTEASFPDLRKVLLALRDHRYSIEKRSMLQLKVWEGNTVICKAHAINDMVLESADRSRLTRLRVRIAGEPSANFPSDGLIISSATGSTAYSLSAGGPVVHPSLDVMILTPICPHALHARPLVIPMKDSIEVEPYPPYEDIIVSADGMTVANLQATQRVVIEKCPFDARFARLSPVSYYATWQERLLRNEGQTIV
jgi:NAD+ kinase